MKNKIAHAFWDIKKAQYFCKKFKCYSSDGEIWFDGNGMPMDTPKFYETTFMLHGGESNGLIIS